MVYSLTHFWCLYLNRKPSDSAASRDTEALILDTVKSAVRFQKNVGDAWIKVCVNKMSIKNHTQWGIKYRSWSWSYMVLIEWRLNVPVTNISVMSGLLPDRGREKRRMVFTNFFNFITKLHPYLPQVKQISFCQQAKYDGAISLKAAADSAPPYYLAHVWSTAFCQFLAHQSQLLSSALAFLCSCVAYMVNNMGPDQTAPTQSDQGPYC